MKIHPALIVFWLAAACAQAPRSLESTSASAATASQVQPAARAPGARIAQTANPYATKAALEMLDRGGNAIDAIVAAQAMLGLVEPQMSGIAGGTYVLYWDAKARKLSSYDGLAAAPARATASLRTAPDGSLLPHDAVATGGRSVGVPGTLPVLEMVHQRYGKLPWATLFEPAIRQADEGFPIPEYLHRIIALDRMNVNESPSLAMFFDAQGKAFPIGTLVRNPAYATTLRRVGARGAAGLFEDGGAERIVEAAQHGPLPSFMTTEDLRAYHPVERTPICAPFLAYRICTVPPPSYGGIYLLQVLQMVADRANGHYDFDDPAFVHLFLESARMARADRSMYVGDPDFVTVPTQGLIAQAYVRARADSIDPQRVNPEPRAGSPGLASATAPAEELAMGGTSQLTVADGDGDIVAMTTTINLGFGARLMVDGFVLNDVLVNFARAPRAGESLANAMAPGKRPYTSVAPAIVFDALGEVVAAGGSAGGALIPDYLSEGWIELLANGATPAQALARGHFSTATPGKVVLERATAAEKLEPALRAQGYDIDVGPTLSGAGYIRREGAGWIGAADPRRGGNAAQ